MWQSLANSQIGAVMSPSRKYLWKTLTYWSPKCQTAPSHSEHRWTKRGNNYWLRPCIFFSPKTLGSLIWISPNFHQLYRNAWQLTYWNENCDIPIRFRTSVCQMNEDRQISARSQHNFHFIPHFNSKTAELLFITFLNDEEQLVELLMYTCSRQWFISFQNTRAKSEYGHFWRLQKSPKIIWLP